MLVLGGNDGTSDLATAELLDLTSGDFGVLGSVLAMVIAIQFGISVTLACGAFFYFCAAMLMRGLIVRS